MLIVDFNVCLRVGTFSRRWKWIKMFLLSKPRKPKGLPSSYRPLCLLVDVGKILEAILVDRIEEFIATSKVELAENQFCFRKE